MQIRPLPRAVTNESIAGEVSRRLHNFFCRCCWIKLQHFISACWIKLCHSVLIILQRRLSRTKQSVPTHLLRVPASQEWHMCLFPGCEDCGWVVSQKISINREREPAHTGPTTFTRGVEHLLRGYGPQRRKSLRTQVCRKLASLLFCFCARHCGKRARYCTAFTD